jgi:hypothetical protein
VSYFILNHSTGKIYSSGAETKTANPAKRPLWRTIADPTCVYCVLKAIAVPTPIAARGLGSGLGILRIGFWVLGIALIKVI